MIAIFMAFSIEEENKSLKIITNINKGEYNNEIEKIFLSVFVRSLFRL